MSKLKLISGNTCIQILCKHFGFRKIRQKGSHIILRNESIGTVVPNHKELKRPTLRNILKLAQVSIEEFEKYL